MIAKGSGKKMQLSNLKWLWLSAVVILLDQLTKYWAEHILGRKVIAIFSWFDLSLVHNTGAAFGFLNQGSGWQNLMFLGLAAVVSVVLVFMIRALKSHELQLMIAYSLIVAGALSNAIDRIIYQYVVDFIHWFYLECNIFGMYDCHFPHFNIADAAIFVGAALMLLEAFGKPILNRKQKSA